MLQRLPCGRSVPEPNQLPKLQTPPKVHQLPMWKRSKNQFTTVHHAIWEQLSLYYRLFWLFFVYCLPFIYTIITEVVLNTSCTGINNIKNRHRPVCLRQSQFQSFHQRIPHQHSIHQYHHHEQNDYRKRSTK